MTRLLRPLLLGFIPLLALANGPSRLSVQEEARALRGSEYLLAMHGQQIASPLSCTDEGGKSLTIDGIDHDDWASGLLKCQGRWVVILKHKVGEVGSRTKWRIADTLLLPPIQFGAGPQATRALQLTGDEECEARGGPDSHFIVLARYGKRDRIDWRTGVEKAWTFDLERGRIVPLSTKRIVCEAYEP